MASEPFFYLKCFNYERNVKHLYELTCMVRRTLFDSDLDLGLYKTVLEIKWRRFHSS